ncbi:hypothetical protein BD779DRAFT_536629 [Infundibulicybe gibba]|nr:hypothetical protein BD779DRAFT_536629 [Infundibulicybe gibba]
MSYDSHASINGIAVLENARRLSNASKVFVFDAQFFLGTSEKPALIAYLQYFNSDNLTFSPLPTKYMVSATIAKMDKAVDLHQTPESHLDPDDYDIVGDIYELIPLGPVAPDGTADSDESANDINKDLDSELETLALEYIDPKCLAIDTTPAAFPPASDTNIAESIDPCRRPKVYICGHVTNSNKKTATFELSVNQYISAFKDITTAKAVLPVQCIIPDSPRYKSGKPVPFDRRYVYVTGYLTDVLGTQDAKGSVEQCFRVEVTHITTLGYYTPTVAPAKTIRDNSTPSPAGCKRKLGFSFNGSPSPAPAGKRRRLGKDLASGSLSSITNTP